MVDHSGDGREKLKRFIARTKGSQSSVIGDISMRRGRNRLDWTELAVDSRLVEPSLH